MHGHNFPWEYIAHYITIQIIQLCLYVSTGIAGGALFLAETVPIRTLLCEFRGERISPADVDARFIRPDHGDARDEYYLAVHGGAVVIDALVTDAP